MASIPGTARFERMPTRSRIRLGWAVVLLGGACYQLVNLTVLRVNPKREEQFFETLEKKYGGEIPDKFLKQAVAIREFRDTVTLQQTLATPTPGESNQALHGHLDFRRLGQLKKS